MTDDVGLPEINALVDVRFPDGREYPSRIEGADGGNLTLAAPFGGGVEPPELGSTVEVCWTSRRGRYTVAVRLLRIDHARLSYWEVVPAGPVQLSQRRRFARAAIGGEPIRIRVDATGTTLAGTVVDLSEGGVRCWVVDGTLAAGEQVTVTVGLDDDELAINGEVLRVTARRTGKGLDVVVVFDLAEAAAGVVRRYVMRAQLLARRLAAGSTS